MQDASVWPDSTLTLTDLFFKLYSNLVGKFVRELQAVEILNENKSPMLTTLVFFSLLCSDFNAW